MTKRSLVALVFSTLALTACGESTGIEIETSEPTTRASVEAKSTKNGNTVTDGTYEVGTDIKAGKYRTKGLPDGCYVERLRDLQGSIDSIISNASVDGPGIIVIMKDDAYVKFSGGCVWKKS